MRKLWLVLAKQGRGLHDEDLHSLHTVLLRFKALQCLTSSSAMLFDLYYMVCRQATYF